MTLQLMSKSIHLLLSFQMYVSGQRRVLELLVAVWIERVVLLTGESPLVMVAPLLHRGTCQSRIDLFHWNLPSWNCLVGFLLSRT